MSIKKRWHANCDAQGCSAQKALYGDQYDGKAELGMSLDGDGWQASPGVDETYCPDHAKDPEA